MTYKDPEVQKQKMKEWKEKHKEEIAEYNHAYYLIRTKKKRFLDKRIKKG